MTESPYPRLVALLEEIRVLAQEKAIEIDKLRADHSRLLEEAADLRAEVARLQSERHGWLELFVANSKALLDENERLKARD